MCGLECVGPIWKLSYQILGGLPRVTGYHFPMPRPAIHHALILADGTPIPRPLLDRLRRAHGRGRFVITLDGAAERARREGWVPDLVTGDFDSVKPATLAHLARRGARILPAPDQDFTDLEKALAWCGQLKDLRTITIAQAWGRRTDHSLAALTFLKRFHRRGRIITLLTATETIRFVRSESLTLTGKSGRGLALIPFPLCKATSRGLSYEMKALRLELGERASLSNRVEKKSARLTIRGEALVIEEQS